MRHPREVRRQGRDPAFLGASAGDPVNVVVTGQTARSRCGIGRLAVVDEGRLADLRDHFLTVRQPGKGLESFRDRLTGETKGQECSIGRRSILPVMDTQQRANAREISNLHRLLAGLVDEDAILDVDSAGYPPLDRNGNDRAPAPTGQFGMNPAADIVVNADHGGLGRGPAREDARFRSNVVREIAVTLNVVGRHIQQHRDVAHQGPDQVELERTEFQHIDAVLIHGVEIKDRDPNVAAQLHIMACGLQQVRGQG